MCWLLIVHFVNDSDDEYGMTKLIKWKHISCNNSNWGVIGFNFSAKWVTAICVQLRICLILLAEALLFAFFVLDLLDMV